LTSLHTRQGFVASFTSPFDIIIIAHYVLGVKRFRKLFTRLTTPNWRTRYCLLVQCFCINIQTNWLILTHFRVQRLALLRGVFHLLPVLSQGRAPSDFLGYSLLTLSIIADSNLFVYHQNDEFRDNLGIIFCLFCLLTKVPTCGTLEIVAARGRRKFYHFFIVLSIVKIVEKTPNF